VVIGLWDSWEDDAFTRDKATGRFYDPAKLHPLNHQGTHFRVRGPLNVARSPQGRPVIVQAGSSPAGKDFAARTAEVIFTAQQTEEDAQAFYRDVKERLPRYHRRADELKVMPGIYPVIGSSESEAIAKYQELQDLILPEVGLSLLSTLIGEFDLSRFPADSPLPELPETNNLKSRQTLMYEIARKRRFTIRDLYLWVAGARGHWTIIGTAGQIADQLQSWFEHGAADGFNLMPPVLPTGLDDIVEHLVPELQRRGLFRREYEGSTLRDNLGLERPVNRHAAARSSAGRQSAVTA
jgi:alkanesulfonate monooxygenase